MRENGLKVCLISVLFVFLPLLVGCGSVRDIYAIDRNIKKIELGMTKHQVEKIAGSSYKILEMVQTPGESVEVWGYLDLTDGMYRLTFVNGTLKFLVYDPPVPEYHEHRKRQAPVHDNP